MRSLIINADDFGYDRDTVDATIELIERGVVTSATLLLCGDDIDRAIDYAVHGGSNCSFGLHFNIVDGYLATQPSTLTDAGGRFRPSMQQRIRALAGLLDADDIRSEFRSQASVLRDRGVAISHVDSHGHLHKWPAVAGALAPALAEFAITAMRRPQNVYFRRRPLDLLDVYCAFRFPRVRTTDYYCAVDPEQPEWLPALSDLMPEGVAELSVHPGKTEPWRRQEFAPLAAVTPTFFEDRGFQLKSFRHV
jgi:chitin disaccharide deacetylase